MLKHTGQLGRDIPQILLIHCNELNAISLRASIARMRARGYQFITLGRTISAAGPRVPDWVGALGRPQ